MGYLVQKINMKNNIYEYNHDNKISISGTIGNITITLTTALTPKHFKQPQSLVRGHSTIRVTNWTVPDYDFIFFVFLDLVILFSYSAFGLVIQHKSVSKLSIHSSFIHIKFPIRCSWTR